MSDEEEIVEETKTAEDYYHIGMIASAQKKYDDAIAYYTKAIKLDSNNELFYLLRAKARHEIEDFNGVIYDCDYALKLNPYNSDTYYSRGLAQYEMQDYESTIADLNKAIIYKEDNFELYFTRGKVKYETQDYNGAILDFTQAIALGDDSQPLVSIIKDYKQRAKIQKEQSEATLKNEIIKSQEALKVSKQEYDKLGQEVRELKTKTEEFLSGVTAKGLSETYNHQSKWQFRFYMGLRLLEAGIYVAIACFLYTKGFPWLEGLLNDKEITTSQIIFMFIIKIGIFIPVYLLVRLINTTANRFAQRQELDGDTATQWAFFDKMEIELKNLKDNSIYAELYRDFMAQNISLRQKTNFERIEEIFAKRHDKSMSLKQIDALADTAKKIKEVCVTPKEEKKEDK